MGVAAGIGAAAAAGQLGMSIANSTGGGGGGRGGGSYITSVNTPGFTLNNNVVGDNYGSPVFQPTLTPNPSSPGNQLFAQFPNLFNNFGQLAGQAETAGNNFLQSVGLGGLNSGQPINGLSATPGPGVGFNPNMSAIFAPLQQIENARQNALSTLSDSLSKRGVLGSSFGGSQIAGLNSEFGQAAANTALNLASTVQNSQLQTVQAVGQQIQNQQSIAQAAMQEELSQLSITAGQGNAAAAQMSQNSQFQAQLAADVAQGQGALQGFTLSQLSPLLKSLTGGTGTTTPTSTGNNFSSGFGGGNPFTFLGGGGETSIPSSIGNFNVGGGF